ncbi:MAG TPA: chemotaxis protein CheW [Burkholderiaceae bacterium]|nr:chemotaxis protein CheW [Burkholderiaceae bacterium]
MATQRDVGPRQLVKLREFSTQLAQRLKEAPNLPTEPTRLAIRIGADNYLVEMGLASEIVALPEIARVPWTKPWYRGLANVRGRLVGVVDLQQLMGREPLPSEQAQQLLVLGESLGVAAGVLMTRAFGIRNLKDLEPLEAVPSRGEWERTRYRDLDNIALTELDLRDLAGSPAFTAIHA